MNRKKIIKSEEGQQISTVDTGDNKAVINTVTSKKTSACSVSAFTDRSKIDQPINQELTEKPIYNTNTQDKPSFSTERKIGETYKRDKQTANPDYENSYVDDDKEDTVIHDLLLIIITSVCTVVVSGLIKCINITITTTAYIVLSFLKAIGLIYFFQQVLKVVVKLIILPIVDTVHPVVDIEKKFDRILQDGRDKLKEVNLDDLMNIDTDPEVELTQFAWNTYITKLQATEKGDYDVFDVLISQNVTQINFMMTVAINRSESVPRYITFSTFYTKLHSLLGDAVNIKYRYTTNKTLFVGIFNDDGPYRRFRFYDSF